LIVFAGETFLKRKVLPRAPFQRILGFWLAEITDFAEPKGESQIAIIPFSMVLLLPWWEKELEDEGEHKYPSSTPLRSAHFPRGRRKFGIEVPSHSGFPLTPFSKNLSALENL